MAFFTFVAVCLFVYISSECCCYGNSAQSELSEHYHLFHFLPSLLNILCSKITLANKCVIQRHMKIALTEIVTALDITRTRRTLEMVLGVGWQRQKVYENKEK